MGYVKVKTPFATGRRVFTAGMVVDAKELTQGQMQFTVPFPPVEQATAAPGERRNVSIPKAAPEKPARPAGGLTTKSLPKTKGR